ncbi:MAG: GNAT family N-acetyltransferase [Candidatus Marinimicrobia bacterium]|nr:GNAT family N-acetyltransferase [Candidatus Neomarinimicrobiota bacterium]
MIELKHMTDQEYDEFFPIVVDSYTNELVKNMKMDVELARTRSLDETNKLLPDGLNTENHYFYSITNQNGMNVGGIWIQITKKSKLAFIFFIHIKESYRRQGYGKKALAQLENKLRDYAINRIQLNVFENNDAQKLYEKMDYKIVSHTMQKWIVSE